MLPPERTTGSTAARLALARGLAWSLLIAGWLVLGTLGRQHAPHAAGGLALVALWLALLGALLALAARRAWSPAALRVALLMASGLVAAGAALLAGRFVPTVLTSLLMPVLMPLALALLAAGWALLLVTASLSVRMLRSAALRRPPTPAGPALAGAMLAWGITGDGARWLAAPLAQGLALAVLALLLAALLPRRAPPVSACRAGLFDCALVLAPLTEWRRPSAWPQATAALAMLPMMATLTVLAEWCGGRGNGAAASSAAHLATMFLPALAARAWAAVGRPGPSPMQAAAGTATLLVAGGLALAWPGLAGLMAAGLLHGMAWGWAWAARWSVDGATRATPATQRSGLAAAGPAALAGLMVLALGTAVAAWGPSALATVHSALALLGALGAAALVWPRPAADRQPPAPAGAAGLSRNG